MKQRAAPPEIEPGKFFTEVVPVMFDKFKTLVPSMSFMKATICFELTGQGGGIWTLKIGSGALVGKAGDDPDRMVKFEQSIEDWLSAWRGEKGMRIELPEEGSENYSGNLYLDQTAVEKLKKVSGSVKLRVTDPEKGEWVVAMEFGTKKDDLPAPQCVITISSNDAAAIREGKLDPNVAFMSGKINISGDIGLVMQIAAILIS